MQQIHDDAQRQSLHKDNQIVQLQVEHQQIADELQNRTEDCTNIEKLYKQHYDAVNTQLQQAQQAPSLQIVQTLQNELSQAHQVVKSQQWAQNNEHDESVKRIKELEQQVLHAEAVNFDLMNNTPCKVCQTFKQELNREMESLTEKNQELNQRYRETIRMTWTLKEELQKAKDQPNRDKEVSAIKCLNFDLQVQLDEERKEVAGLQRQIKDQLQAKSKPPRPKSFSMHTPRTKPASSVTPASVPKLDIPSPDQPLDDQNYYGENDEYGNPEGEYEDEWDEEWEEEEQQDADEIEHPEEKEAETAEEEPLQPAAHRKSVTRQCSRTKRLSQFQIRSKLYQKRRMD